MLLSRHTLLLLRAFPCQRQCRGRGGRARLAWWGRISGLDVVVVVVVATVVVVMVMMVVIVVAVMVMVVVSVVVVTNVAFASSSLWQQQW